MAIKVTKEGHKLSPTYKFECRNCGCEAECLNSDIACGDAYIDCKYRMREQRSQSE